MRSAVFTTLPPGFCNAGAGLVAQGSATRTSAPLPAPGTSFASRAPLKGAVAAVLLLFGTVAAAAADDLVAKRAACVEVARDRITARGRAGSEFYRFLVERRKAFVQKCMEEKGS